MATKKNARIRKTPGGRRALTRGERELLRRLVSERARERAARARSS